MSPPAFVGRERPLAALGEALARPPAVVLVEGEAGIGKSRLLREFLDSPAGLALGPSVLVECPPLREPYTLGPVVDAVRLAADRVAGLGLSGLSGALRPLFPEWAADLSAAPEPAADARAARHRLFRALMELFERLAVAVLVVEDVHWADDATLEFLLFVASRQPQPVSLVVTYRPEDTPTDSLLLRLSSRVPAGVTRTRLTLGPLDVAETAGLVSSMLGGERLSAKFARFLHRHTDGVPLAVEESVRLMHDRADMARHRGGWIRRHLEDIDVPPTVRDAVLERTIRLGADALTMLRAAAVLADRVGEALLVAVSGLPADRTAAGMTEALDCGLLREDDRGFMALRHGLASRAVYDAIPGPERRAMHQRAGRALEQMSPRPVARLARHFREAGDTEAWVRYAEQAADVATSAGDLVGAASLLHDLLTNADLAPAAVAPLAAKIPHGALNGRSRMRDVAHVLDKALGSGALDAGKAALARFRLGMALEQLTDYDAARREMEAAVPDLPPGSLERLDAMLFLGWPLGSSCPGRVHREWLARAAEAAGSTLGAFEAATRVDSVLKRTTAMLLLGEPEGWTVAATLPDEVATPMQRRNVVHGGVNLGEMAMRWGRYTEARRRLGSALTRAEEYGYPLYRDLALDGLLVLDWLTGAWNGLAERAGELAEAEEVLPMQRLKASLVVGLLQAARGRFEEADGTLRRVLAQMRDLGAVESTVHPAAALAALHLAGGRPAEALAVTEEPIGVVRLKETWLWATELAPVRVDALVAAGRQDEAAELVAAFADGVNGREAPAPQAAVTQCRAILCAARGEHARAAALFARAAADWEALPRPFDALLAGERRARCLLAAGQREAGLSVFAEVAAGLADLGARAAADRVLQTLRDEDAGGPRRGRPGYGDRLSPRELEVVRLLVEGRNNREIADALVLARQTVNSHVRSAMRKLRVSSRTALAVSAVGLGLAGDDDAVPDDE